MPPRPDPLDPTARLDGLRTVVMGLGRFGGGVAAARHLATRGADVLATDLGSGETLAGAIADLEGLPIRFRLEGHAVEDFADADLVVVNPAVPRPWENPFLEAARAGGARLLTEIRLAIARRPAANLIGITGTAGKSTTAAMVQHALERVLPDLDAHLSGNIGGSLLDDPPPPSSSLVLELSSFMLHWTSGEGGRPEDRVTPGVAAVTNLAPNHLDWHVDFEHYARCKRSIASPSPICESPILVENGTEPRPEDAGFRLRIPGDHNRSNAGLACRIALAHAAVRTPERSRDELEPAFRTALESFPGLPHRLESLGQFRGIHAFNDSKSTTPEATALAVASFDDASRVHLIVGGYDKGVDLAGLTALASNVASLHGIGATGPRIAKDVGQVHPDLGAAVRSIMAQARAGDVILLSPGCASWDQFDNFEARGSAFRDALDGFAPE